MVRRGEWQEISGYLAAERLGPKAASKTNGMKDNRAIIKQMAVAPLMSAFPSREKSSSSSSARSRSTYSPLPRSTKHTKASNQDRGAPQRNAAQSTGRAEQGREKVLLMPACALKMFASSASSDRRGTYSCLLV